jgi:hypothetical protein
MHKQITITFDVNNLPAPILLFYDVETDGNMQTITCTVNPDDRLPEWLHARKFELRSWLSDGTYMPLYNDNEQLYNMDALLFIDKAYSEIMEQEHFSMA